ncbi:pre-mRNA-splicing factor SYF2 [Coemansia asiatica]|uniref:Pre-mRNA-splicing factor SYF2 n=1 Tax=Coemansia asiatica TaxID=1052880 RepID=A0A9W7XQV1_9FUNG|nr:pre-mRNA-splicing factor SYF2 [Coemansia asiatica]
MSAKQIKSDKNNKNEPQVAETTEQKQKHQKEEEEEEEEEHEQAKTSSSSDETNSSDDESSDDETPLDITERTDIPDSLKPQIDRLRSLRTRLAQSAQENKREIYKEHQRKNENPGDQRRQERKRREAEKLQKREEYAGDDFERSRFMQYSIEQVQRYEEKRAKGKDNVERGFTDYAQVNQRKYEREVAKIRPDLAAYQREKESGRDASVPDPRKVDKLVKTVEEQQRKRAKLNKPSIEQEGEDVSYINDRNARFNRKMNRAYDKYTKDIKDNFERGTAM